MSAANIDLFIVAGQPMDPSVVYWTVKSRVNNVETPIDFTGCSAKSQIRSSFGSSLAIVSLDSADGKIILGGIAGTISLAMTAAETAVLWAGNLRPAPSTKLWNERQCFELGPWDLKVFSAGGIPYRQFQGMAYIVPEATHD